MIKVIPGAIVLLILATPASSQETTTYSYDPRGRLVQVSRSGSVNGGVSTSYQYDRADNRTNVLTTGSSAGPVVANWSLENPDLGSGFDYRPTVQGMTFSDGSGIAANGSAWGFVAAPDGKQVGFVQRIPQGLTNFSTSVTGLTPGSNYSVTIRAAQRPGFPSHGVTVKVQGTPIGTFIPPDTNFTAFTTSAFQALGTSATIELFSAATGVDAAVGIDSITVSSASQ